MLINSLLRIESLLAKLDSEGVLIVASANNHAESEGIPISRYPAKFADPGDKYGGLANMVVASAANWKTERAIFAQFSSYVTTFGPGNNIACPGDPFLDPNILYRPCDGTSYGKFKSIIP